jgi:hypothetical protein
MQVPKLHLNVDLQLLFICWSANVYVYEVGPSPSPSPSTRRAEEAGEVRRVAPRWTWTGLHDQPVTCVVMLHVPSNKHGGNLIITGSRDTKVKVRRLWERVTECM